MTGFLLGLLSGAIVGGAASFAKNPVTHHTVRKDIQDAASNLSDSCDDVRATYSALQENRKAPEENADPETVDELQETQPSIKDKAQDLVTAVKSVAKKNDDINHLVDRAKDLRATAEVKNDEVKDALSKKNDEVRETLARTNDEAKEILSHFKENLAHQKEKVEDDILSDYFDTTAPKEEKNSNEDNEFIISDDSKE